MGPGAASMNEPTNLLNLDSEALTAWCAATGERSFRAKQLQRWIHQRGVADFALMTDLAKSFRESLQAKAKISAPAIISDYVAQDGTRKWLFDVGAGDAIETVFIPEANRGTLCVSTQAGCAVNCAFCATGHQGFSRNLQLHEVIGQLWRANQLLADSNRLGGDAAERPISNVVFMGMGEPLQNYQVTLSAVRLMLDDLAYGLSRRRVTVSTSGVVPMIDRLAIDCPVALAVSLHAPTDSLRDRLVPLNKKYPLAQLMAACQRYLDYAPRDFITLEYVMLDGVNDRDEHAHQLAELTRDLSCKFNLIPFNPFAQSALKRSPAGRIQAFAKILTDAGIVTTVRKTRGDDIAAACGQLAGEITDRTDVAARRAVAIALVVQR